MLLGFLQAEGQLAGMADLTQRLAAAKQDLANAATQVQQHHGQLQQVNTDLTATRKALAQEQQAFGAWKSKVRIVETGCSGCCSFHHHVWISGQGGSACKLRLASAAGCCLWLS